MLINTLNQVPELKTSQSNRPENQGTGFLNTMQEVISGQILVAANMPGTKTRWQKNRPVTKGRHQQTVTEQAEQLRSLIIRTIRKAEF